MSKTNTHKLIVILLVTFSLIKISLSACNIENCPPSRGLCNANVCVCEENFQTVNNEYVHNNGIFCNYKLKSRFVAFLLEFFFPFGVGHFYSGKTYFAVIKIGLFVVMICMCCSMICCGNAKVAKGCQFIIALLIVLCVIGILGMQIFDLIGYALGIYKDGNGVEMS